MKIRFLLLVFYLLIYNNIKSQDAEFSQFYANKLYLNPAFTGVDKCPSISLNTRKQWSIFNDGILTNSISYNQYSDLVKGGIGFMIFNDNVSNGLLVNNQISFIYSRIIHVSTKFSISFGIQTTYINKKIDHSRFIFGDQLNLYNNKISVSNEPIINESIHLFDLSSGILIYSHDIFIGVSSYHLTRPNESFGHTISKLPIRMGVNIGYNFYFNDNNKFRQTIILTPCFLYRNQGVFRQYNIGVYLNYGVFIIGIWNRIDDSIINSFGINYKKIKFAYSFDYSINDYNRGASHELSFNIMMKCIKRKKFRPLSCPSF